MANAHEHLEHAEHAGHHAADPFDRRVAVSVAIVAAILAGISMLGHRKHNQVIELQTEATILHTRATDTWGEYQAVNVRDHGYEFAAGLLRVTGKLDEEATKNATPNPKAKTDEKRKWDLATWVKYAENQHAKYEPRLPKLEAEAQRLVTTAAAKQDAAHHAHDQANRLDLAHLGAEIAIVLCSLALLTKKKVFWYAGILSASLAIGTGASAYLIADHTHAHGSNPAEKH